MYDYVVKYRKGATNVEADMLSRNPVSHHVTDIVHLLTGTELADKQDEIKTRGTKYQKMSGLLTVQKKGFTKVVVPQSLKLKLLERAHDGQGHPGVKKMIGLISPIYYWVKIQTDIANYVKHCEVCQLNKKSHQRKFGFLGSLPVAKEPYDIISIDTVGGLSYYGSTKNYLHVVVDHATRYVWTFPSKSLTTETYTNILTQIFSEQKPKMLLSDRHPSFTAAKFRRFLRKKGVKQLLTSANRPQSNGRNEVTNAIIMSRLRCKINEGKPGVPWTKLLRSVTQEYNNTVHLVTKFPPTFLMRASGPYDPPIPEVNFSYPPIAEARQLAAERTEAEHLRSKEKYDRKHAEPKFDVGDIVKYEIYRSPSTRKLTPVYTGPFEIVEKRTDLNYVISKPNQIAQSSTDLVHVSRLRHFFAKDQFKLHTEE